MASGEIFTDKGHISGDCPDGGVGGEAALENASKGVSMEVVRVRVQNLLSSENALERKQTVIGVLEMGWDTPGSITK